MKTVLRITKDYYSSLSYEDFREEINYLVNELNIFCEIKNNNYINIIEEQKNYSSSIEEYKNKISISAIGYCQSEWQEYTLYYNETELNTPQMKMYFSSLLDQLQKSFTHFNDYFCEKYERTEIDGKTFNSEPFDYTSFYIRYIEFPSKEDIIEEYMAIYGEDFDILEIETN